MNRTVIACSLAGAAALALPAIGSANITARCTGPTTVDVGFHGFNPSPYTGQLVINGANRSVDQVYGFVGPSALFTATDIVGPGTVSYTAYRETFTATFGNCDVPVTPPPNPPVPPVPPVVPPTPPTNITKVTCSTLKANGAGKKWLVKLGCTPKKRAYVTCSTLKARKAGKQWYVRLGFPFKCDYNGFRRVTG